MIGGSETIVWALLDCLGADGTLMAYAGWEDNPYDKRPERFYALGNFGQYVYVAPDANAVIVRNGSDWGIENDAWLATFRDIADRLAGTS